MGSQTDADKLNRRNYELSILNEIAAALNREVDLEHALRTTLAHVAAMCGLETGWIWLVNEDTGDPYLAVTQNLPPALANKPHRMKGTTYCQCLYSYQEGDMDGAANINVVTCTRLDGLIDGTDGLRYHASIPLYAHGKQLGLLNVASTDWRELSPDDLQLLYTVGDLLSMAIERARLFSRSVEAGAVEERTRIAREIHDTLAQGLTAIALQLETADALLETDGNPERIRLLVQQALTLTRNNLDEARRSVLDLRAAPLEGRTLPEALDTLARDYAARWNMKLEINIEAKQVLPSRLETGLYRIAQEALSNAVRHAQARTLTLQLASNPQEIRLTIEDDGQGFDPEQVEPGRYGLIGLNERVKLLGGTLHLCSTPGEGTSIDVVLPVQKAI
ncbi:MAG TPA: GAF domain-containing sensor histidine kinase [Phototrophicaceae bacterium]|nr:GAF domain-containing sensor histidine kinase [Phototrophicaceae bacterium]